jgi:hypothetical protein
VNLAEMFRSMRAECLAYPEPAKDAEPGEHWAYLWRQLYAAMLTWRFLALVGVVEAVVILIGGLT